METVNNAGEIERESLGTQLEGATCTQPKTGKRCEERIWHDCVDDAWRVTRKSVENTLPSGYEVIRR